MNKYDKHELKLYNALSYFGICLEWLCEESARLKKNEKKSAMRRNSYFLKVLVDLFNQVPVWVDEAPALDGYYWVLIGGVDYEKHMYGTPDSISLTEGIIQVKNRIPTSSTDGVISWSSHPISMPKCSKDMNGLKSLIEKIKNHECIENKHRK